MSLPSYRPPYRPVPYAQPEFPFVFQPTGPLIFNKNPLVTIPLYFAVSFRPQELPAEFPSHPDSQIPRIPHRTRPHLLLPLFSILGDNALPVADRAQAARPTPVEADGVILVAQCVRAVGG